MQPEPGGGGWHLTVAAAPPRTVAFYSPGWPAGRVQNGIVTYLGGLLPAIERAGVRAHVVSAFDLGDGPQAAVDLAGLRSPRARRVLLRALRRAPGRSSGIDLGWAIAAGVRALGAGQTLDLLEMEETFGAAWHVQQVLDLPVVVRLHGPWFLNGAALGVPRDRAFRRREAAERRCIVQAPGVTAPSRDVLERTRARYQLPLADARVIPYPVASVPEERRWRLEACDRQTILFVGRFDRHKGGDLVVDAFREVAAAWPTARLLFVGPDRGLRDDAGNHHDLAGYVAARLPAEARARVELLGPLSAEQLAPLRRRAFVTVVASRYETFCLALAEALAAGCPTVAPEAGAMPEVLVGDRTGLLFRAGDAADLGRRVLELLRDPARAATLGAAAGHDVATRFAPDRIARETLDFHAHVLARGARRRRLGPGLWRALYVLGEVA